MTLLKLEHQALPFEVDSLSLHCDETLDNNSTRDNLPFNRQSLASTTDLEMTLAKLKTRLGNNAVYKISYHDEIIPEGSNLIIQSHEECNETLPAYLNDTARPSWIYPSPILLDTHNAQPYWRGVLYFLQGPERIETHWWRTPIARDYYIVQREDAIRAWIYFDLHKRLWFAHGVFS